MHLVKWASFTDFKKGTAKLACCTLMSADLGTTPLWKQSSRSLFCVNILIDVCFQSVLMPSQTARITLVRKDLRRAPARTILPRLGWQRQQEPPPYLGPWSLSTLWRGTRQLAQSSHPLPPQLHVALVQSLTTNTAAESLLVAFHVHFTF